METDGRVRRALRVTGLTRAGWMARGARLVARVGTLTVVVAASGGFAAEPGLVALAGTAAVGEAGSAPANPGLTRFEFSEPHMGTTVRLVLFAPDQATAEGVAEQAFQTFARLDSLFSDYRADSEIAALAAAAGTDSATPISGELLELLRQAQGWHARTGGAFDVTVGSMTQLWRWAIRRGELPDEGRLQTARDRVDASSLRLDPSEGTAALRLAGMSLDLGGIAKGYAAQRVMDQLRAARIVHAMVDAGGDLVLGAAPPDESGWRVEFPDGQVHHLADVAVATSGDRYQYLEVGGVRYSHILDPGTGLGIEDAPTVVVVAADGVTADVLASALTVLAATPARVERLAHDNPGVAIQILADTEDRVMLQSPGFPRPRAQPGSTFNPTENQP